MDKLTNEVQTILSVPYLASLKTLHDLIQDVETCALRKWADENISQILPLATTVVESLPLWPYTLGILAKLATVCEFRDAVLSIDPRLLGDLLEKATNSEKDHERFSPVCLSLLSEPLPQAVPLPSAAQLFFHQSFSRAVRDPSVKNLEGVYNLLHGACSSLPDILSQQDLDEFRAHLIKMMRAGNTEQLLPLLCLAIIADINKGYKGDPSSMTDTIIDTPKRTPSSVSVHSRKEVEKFFTGDKAHRTLHLISLQVVYACQSKGAVDRNWGLRHIAVSRRILEAISQDVRATWIEDNAAIVKKLIEKTLQNTRDPDVQLEALAFLSLLGNTVTLPPTVCNLFQSILLNVKSLRMDKTSFDHLMSLLVPYFSSQITQSFWMEFSREILQCGSTLGHTAYGSLRKLRSVINNLKIAVVENANARTGIVNAISSVHLNGAMDQFFSQVASQGTEPLDQTSSWMIKNHQSAVTCLILNATVSTELDEVGLQSHLARRLVEMQQEVLTVQRSPKTFCVSTHTRSFLSHTYPTNLTKGASKQWREKLAIEMGIDSRSQEQRMIAFVENICQDFESRCENVEQPLRDEEQKHSDLKRKFNELQESTEDFKLKLVRRESEYENLQSAKTAVDGELVEAVSNIARLSQKIEDLEKKAMDQEEKHKIHLEEARRIYESEELELRTTIACQVEEIDDKTAIISSLEKERDAVQRSSEDEREKLRSTLALREGDMVQAKSRTEALEQETHQLQTALTDTKILLDESSRESVQLSSTLAELRDEIKQLENRSIEFERAKQEEIHQLRSSREQDACDYEEKISSMQQQFDKQVDSAARSYEEERKEYKQINKTLQDKVEGVQAELDRSAKECHTKAKQLEEAMTMKTRLLRAMGIDEPEREQPKMRTDSDIVNEAVLSQQSQPKRRLKSASKEQDSKDKVHTNESEPSTSRTTACGSERVSGNTNTSTSFRVPPMLQHSTEQRNDASKSTLDRRSLGRLPLTDASKQGPNHSPGKSRRWSDDRVVIMTEDGKVGRGKAQNIQSGLSPLDEFSQALIDVEKENADITSSASAMSNLDIHEDDFDGTTVEL